MTDPLLEYRSLDLRSAVGAREGLRFQVTAGFLGIPGMRGEDVVVPAREGRDDGNRIADVNSILLAGRVQALTTATWRYYTDLLLAVLNESLVDPGALIARGSYMGLGSGETASINARVKNAIEGPVLAGGRFQTWSIELESIDPYWSRA